MEKSILCFHVTSMYGARSRLLCFYYGQSQWGVIQISFTTRESRVVRVKENADSAKSCEKELAQLTRREFWGCSLFLMSTHCDLWFDFLNFPEIVLRHRYFSKKNFFISPELITYCTSPILGTVLEKPAVRSPHVLYWYILTRLTPYFNAHEP